MIVLKYSEGCEPVYQSQASAAADLRSNESMLVPAGKSAKVGTGVWIDKVDWDKVPENYIPELQIRARSGLAFKKGITLSNGVGTVDADYPEEICVLLWNTGDEDFQINKGDRIAQMLLNLVARIPNLKIKGERLSGFGSTGK